MASYKEQLIALKENPPKSLNYKYTCKLKFSINKKDVYPDNIKNKLSDAKFYTYIITVKYVKKDNKFNITFDNKISKLKFFYIKDCSAWKSNKKLELSLKNNYSNKKNNITIIFDKIDDLNKVWFYFRHIGLSK